MDVEGIKVVHAIPGRIRLKVSKVKENPALAREIQERLSTIPRIQRVEANPVTGSVLVLYDAREIASLDSLRALSEPFTSLFPGFDIRELEAWLAPSSNGLSLAPSLAGSISAFFGTLNTGLGKATRGIDLEVLLPLTLFFFGIRGLLASEKVSFPTWYDLFWFSFASFLMLNPRPVEGRQ